MNILVAPDSFKDAAPATQVAEAIAQTLRTQCAAVAVTCAPLSDGGEGMVQTVHRHFDAPCVDVPVLDPLLRPHSAPIAKLPFSALSDTALCALELQRPADSDAWLAVIEMASASGIEYLSAAERNPWHTTSFGTGQLLQAAAEAGAAAILLGIGGSATVDCGVGALEALGTAFYAADLQPVTNLTPAKLKQVATLGSTAKTNRHFPPLRIACDVHNPLTGPNGAAAVFGPQKGLPTEDIPAMDRLLDKTAGRILGLFGIPAEQWHAAKAADGTGAAGGIGFALATALPDARRIGGFTALSALLGWSETARNVDFIITGEGRLDASSLSGKGPVALLRSAPLTPALLLAGSVDPQAQATLCAELPHLAVRQLSPADMPLEQALAETLPNARKAVANWLAAVCT